jgi:hypothetical protein
MEPIIQTKTAKWCGITSLAASYSLLWALMIYGSSTNGLHETAVTGCFVVILSILGGFGFGQIVDKIPGVFGKK